MASGSYSSIFSGPVVFTPTVTLVGGAGNTVPVFSTNTGYYFANGVLIRDFIYLTGDGGAEGAGTGQVNIALSHTAAATFPAGIYKCGTYINSTFEAPLYGVINGAVNTVALYYLNTDQSIIALTGDDLNNATRSLAIQCEFWI